MKREERIQTRKDLTKNNISIKALEIRHINRDKKIE